MLTINDIAAAEQAEKGEKKLRRTALRRKRMRAAFRANVRALCEREGWSFAELARQTGLAASQVRTYVCEASRILPGDDKIALIASALNTSVEELLRPHKSQRRA